MVINQEINYRFITLLYWSQWQGEKEREKLPNFTKDIKGANLITAFKILRFLANISSLKNHLSLLSLYTRRWRVFASPSLQTKTLQYRIPKEPGPTSLRKKKRHETRNLRRGKIEKLADITFIILTSGVLGIKGSLDMHAEVIAISFVPKMKFSSPLT